MKNLFLFHILQKNCCLKLQGQINYFLHLSGEFIYFYKIWKHNFFQRKHRHPPPKFGCTFFWIFIKVLIVVIIIYFSLNLILHWVPLPAFHQVYLGAQEKSEKIQITGIHYNFLGKKIHLYIKAAPYIFMTVGLMVW